MSWGISSAFAGLSPSERQITHTLLTRSPLYSEYCYPFAFDLHVLSTPPAFTLSQDQTLQLNLESLADPNDPLAQITGPG